MTKLNMLTIDDNVSKNEKSPLEQSQNTTKTNTKKVPHTLNASVFAYFMVSIFIFSGSLIAS